MKFATVALVAAAAVSAEVVYDAATGTFKCTGASVDKNFCAGTSLQTNIIIRCDGEKGQPGNCNNNLAGVPPIGVKTAATCYQSSETAGDGACSFAGIVYPDSGETFPVPGYEQPPTYDTTTTTSSVYAPPTYTPPPPVYTTTTSVYVPPPYYPPVNTTTTSIPPPPTYVPPTYVPPTYVPPTSYGPTTLTTVTGTTTTSKHPEPPVPTYVPPPTNHTSYTTSLPVPTYIPSGASNNVASGSLLLGAVAAIGFLFL